ARVDPSDRRRTLVSGHLVHRGRPDLYPDRGDDRARRRKEGEEEVAMGDTVKLPNPESEPGPKKTINPPTSWLETRKEPLPTESPATVVAPASVEEFPEEVRPHALDPHRQLNQYILAKVLGKGGMGEVWKAWDRKLCRWAAIKFLLGESADGVARFK